jgi:hypothetical protein
MGLETRQFAVVPPTEDRVALGDLPRLELYNTDGTPYGDDGEFEQAAAQTDVGAVTSTVAAGANPTKAEFDALRVDALATRTVLNSLLAKLRTASILAP